MNTFPSRAALTKINGLDAKAARMWGKATLAQLKSHPRGAARVAECLHHPPTNDIRMEVLNDIFDTHGVESVLLARGARASYLNTGDMYDLTLFNCGGYYWLSDLGRVVESGGG